MPLSRQRRFPRARSSVSAARTFTLETLAEWNTDLADRYDDVRLCVSELATNALLHGVPPGREFLLTLTTDDSLVRIEVRDSGGGHPEVQAPQEGDGAGERCGGRGLRLVAALADEFGFTAHAPGKTVWMTFKTVPAGQQAG